MKSKALSLIAVIIALIGITTGVAAAQTRRQLTVTAFVPFEFVVANRTFPSGTYVFEMATGAPKATDEAGVLIVRNREQKLYAAVATGVAVDGEIHAVPKLAFRRTGDRVYLSNVWSQGSAASLIVHGSQASTERVEALTLDATTPGGI